MFITYTHPTDLRDKRKRHQVATLSARPRAIYLDPKRTRVRQWLTDGSEQLQLSQQSLVVPSKLGTTVQSSGYTLEDQIIYTPDQLSGSSIDPFASFPTGMSLQAANAINYCETREACTDQS